MMISTILRRYWKPALISAACLIVGAGSLYFWSSSKIRATAIPYSQAAPWIIDNSFLDIQNDIPIRFGTIHRSGSISYAALLNADGSKFILSDFPKVHDFKIEDDKLKILYSHFNGIGSEHVDDTFSRQKDGNFINRDRKIINGPARNELFNLRYNNGQVLIATHRDTKHRPTANSLSNEHNYKIYDQSNAIICDINSKSHDTRTIYPANSADISVFKNDEEKFTFCNLSTRTSFSYEGDLKGWSISDTVAKATDGVLYCEPLDFNKDTNWQLVKIKADGSVSRKLLPETATCLQSRDKIAIISKETAKSIMCMFYIKLENNNGIFLISSIPDTFEVSTDGIIRETEHATNLHDFYKANCPPTHPSQYEIFKSTLRLASASDGGFLFDIWQRPSVEMVSDKSLFDLSRWIPSLFPESPPDYRINSITIKGGHIFIPTSAP